MIWTLRSLIDSTNSVTAEIDGKWVPSRPVNWKYRTFFERVRESWMVFVGKAEAFTWPQGQ